MIEERLCGSAAAYVLGALPPGERATFGEHLGSCAECRETVAEFAGLPGLLLRVSPDDLDETPAPPDTLLRQLLAEVRRQGRRRRIAYAAMAAAAVVAIAFVATVLGSVQGDRQTPAGSPPNAMHAVVASPIHATVAMDDRSWGTELVLKCDYDDYGPGIRAGVPYSLVVTDKAGTRRNVATWTAVPGQVSSITGSVNWKQSQIDAVEVQSASGATVLRLQN
jgi:hypothetical protein